MAQNNIDKLMQATGKKETPKNIHKLQEEIGIKAKNNFRVGTREALDEKMADMTHLDLQKFAVDVGVSATGSRAVLKRKIREQFEKFNKGNHGYGLTFSSEIKLKGKDKKQRRENLLELM